MEIAPSILSVYQQDICKIIQELERIGIRFLHLDVMDNVFIPNLTFDETLIQRIRKDSHLVFDTHLMIQQPEINIIKYIEAGADMITFHLEATHEAQLLMDIIHQKGKKVGIAIKPQTPVEQLQPYLHQLDLVLVMSVEPGFGGQSFQAEMLDKVKWLKQQKENHHYSYWIEIDGGMNQKTLPLAKEAGVDIAVVGTYFFKDGNVEQKWKEFKQL
ncbi:MAG: ribulose-phosphate 3-epimerase [Prevotella sp.]|nr:ribulose-phosphate 3-epimerase [Staphylococcus sp.]MCM1350548.1 ribulose-phosphate 3-epimerase [Prevotella sp.]